MMTLTRRYGFSAAHKLWNHQLSPEENARCFGACGNLHGHNYALEITLSGVPAKDTGMIIDIALLDDLIHSLILSAVDHKYLDEEVPFLQGVISTVENVAQLFYERLSPHIHPPCKLYRLRLYESENNWIEIRSRKDEK